MYYVKFKDKTFCVEIYDQLFFPRNYVEGYGKVLYVFRSSKNEGFIVVENFTGEVLTEQQLLLDSLSATNETKQYDVPSVWLKIITEHMEKSIDKSKGEIDFSSSYLNHYIKYFK